MAPKAKAPAGGGGSLPTLEDEVQWPADVQAVPDPPFFFAIAHIYGHVFHLEGQAESADLPPTLREFDPCGQLVTSLKEESTEDPVARQVIPVDREELLALAEGGSLAKGLRAKAEKESAARKRRKTNRLRTKVVADHEAAVAQAAARREAAAERAAKLAEHEAAVAAATEAGEAPPQTPVFDEAAAPTEVGEAQEEGQQPEVVDFVLAVVGYPESPEELQELRDEGIFDVPNIWLTTYLSGLNIREEAPADPPAGEEPGDPRRVREICAPPPILGTLYDAIHSAELGTSLAYSTICTIPDCHELAPPAVLPDGADTSSAALIAEVRSTIIQVVAKKSERRKAFEEWMGGVAEKKEVPVLTKADSRLYVDLVNSIDPARHDVPLLLHCMCEQVSHSLSGDKHDGHGPSGAPPPPGAGGGEDEELSFLDIYLEDIHQQVVCGEFAVAKPYSEAVSSADGGVKKEPEPNWKLPGSLPEGGVDSLILPFLDRASCRHVGDEFPGHVAVDESVHRLWSHVQAPGVRRAGFPEDVDNTAPRRCAQRNRIYNLMPEVPIVVCEKLLLLDEFERLLDAAQPERTWHLQDRVFHERVPKELVAQVLTDAFRSECFVDTAYGERHDCLLIACYHRSLPARMLWHNWSGDHLAPNTMNTCRTVPTFNDWCQFVAPNNLGEDPQEGVIKRSRLLALDGRETGYCKVLEKLLTPSDRSVIVRTRLQRGLANTFQAPPTGGDLPPEEALEDEEEDEEEDELQLSAGLGDNAKKSKGQHGVGGEAAASDFEPLPRYEMRSTRVVKDSFTFGIVTDESWSSRKPGFQKLREIHELAEAEAAAAAAEEAARKAEEDGAEDADQTALKDGLGDAATLKIEDEDKKELTMVNLENLDLGVFWTVFQDGARCSCRIFHERPFWTEGAFAYDLAETKPGVLLTYSPVVGLTVQVFSDGTVRQTWPPELRGAKLAGNLVAQSSASSLPGSDKLFACLCLPGGPEDCEIARTVTPFGTVVRELLSGRREIYHPDGTCASRNPTLEELRANCETWRQQGKAGGSLAAFELKGGPEGMQELGGPLAYLESLVAATLDLLNPEDAADSLSPPPSESAKSAGLPGHWRIARPSGTVYGRAQVPPAPVAKVDEQEGEAEGDEAPAAEGEGGEAGQDKAASKEETEPPVAWEVRYAESLGGTLTDNRKLVDPATGNFTIDGGKCVEYEIQSVSTTNTIDPHTGQRVATNGEGLLTFEDDGGGRRVCLHADGTRHIWEEKKDGYRVWVERERVARVSIEATVTEFDPGVTMLVECVDGTKLEVTPKRPNAKGDLMPSDPAVPDPLDESTNASVLLRRKDGVIVYSRGTGEINIATGFDLAAKGEKEILRAVETPGLYTAFCSQDVIKLADEDGNLFEVRGDQSVDARLAVSMGDHCDSPRCTKSGEPFRHPHAAFLPLPEDAPDPRLFVVYGDGEAEELLLTRDATERLRLAKKDEECVVVEGEQLGPPMDSCVCHTIFRTASSDAVSVPPMLATMPPSVAAFGYGSGTDAFAPAPGRDFTEFRQFTEYPPISAEQHQRFKAALQEHEMREKQHRAQQAAYGQGFTIKTRKFPTENPEVGGGA